MGLPSGRSLRSHPKGHHRLQGMPGLAQVRLSLEVRSSVNVGASPTSHAHFPVPWKPGHVTRSCCRVPGDAALLLHLSLTVLGAPNRKAPKAHRASRAP